jgi:hypothetical protein
MVKGWSPISVTVELYDRLNDIYESDNKRPENQKFSPWINTILQKFADHSQALKQYGPFLEFKDTSENMIHIFDHKLNKSIDVYINGKKKELQCETDKKTDCLHVGFCFAIPEVYKVLIAGGFKEPKKRIQ